MLDEGIEIFEYQPTMMHTKAMIVDGIFSIIGSANFGNRSFELNDELAIGVFDAELAAQLTARLRNGPQVVEAPRRRRPGRKQRSFDGKINEWFWELLRRDSVLSLDLVLHERGERLDRLVRQAAAPPGVLGHALAHREIALERLRVNSRATPASHTQTLLSSLCENDRLSKFVVPTVDHRPSTIMILWCIIVRLYS